MSQGPDVWVHLSTADVDWLQRNHGGSLTVALDDGRRVRITHDQTRVKTVTARMLEEDR